MSREPRRGEVWLIAVNPASPTKAIPARMMLERPDGLWWAKRLSDKPGVETRAEGTVKPEWLIAPIPWPEDD